LAAHPATATILSVGTQPNALGSIIGSARQQVGVGRAGERNSLKNGAQNSAFAACAVMIESAGIAR
jgi:hypothetical protein